MGGTNVDKPFAISKDDSGSVYIAGWSGATWGSPLNPYAGTSDGFVAKLKSNGLLQWNTFIGGTGNDGASAISIDGSGNIYVAGFSYAAWGAPLGGGDYGAFIAKLLVPNEEEFSWELFYPAFMKRKQ